MDALSAAFSTEVALQLSVPLDSGRYALEDFRCDEAISNPFEMHLIVTTDNANVNLEALMGKPLTVTIFAKPKKRFFNGVVGHISQREFTDKARTSSYHVKLYPAFWLLKFSKDFKIFQNKNPQTIIKQVLQEQGVAQLDDRTQKGGRTIREYCVQYGESHFDFVSRLMEEEGIFYYFEHDNNKHTMVLADQPSAHKDCKEVTQLEVDFSRSEKAFLNVVTDCFIDHQVVIGERSLTDYNYTTPKTNLFAKAKGAGRGKEAYDYPGLVDIDYQPKKGDSEKWSALRSEGDDVAREVVWGQSTCPFFEAGSGFTLQKHLRKNANKRYVLLQVEHHISLVKETEGAKENTQSVTKVICKNAFRAFPASTPFRAPLMTEKPRIHGTQTAVVTGPKGEEIYTDDQRRIKIQFHWDRVGGKDDKTTCWVRVSQAWAANNWGILFTPRVGMEVVVSFINGDPDRPLVTGCVYNADNVPPYLAKDKTMATIKSNTHKGSGFNELRFEDKQQKEEIYLHAQKDWNTHVLENRTTLIEKGSEFITINKGDREVIIKGEPGVVANKGEAPSLSLTGKGSSKKGDDLLTLEKGSRIVKIMGMGADKGSYKTTLTKGDRETMIMQGDNKDTYLKGNDTKTIAEGNKTLMIGKGNESKTIGQGNKSLMMGKGNKLNLITSGNSTLLLPSGMSIGIMQGLFLKVGGFTLALGGGGGSGSEESMPGHAYDGGESQRKKNVFSSFPLGGASGEGDQSVEGCIDIKANLPCGNMVFKFSDTNITIEQNGFKKFQVTKDYEEKVGGKYTLEVDEDIIIKCKGNIKIESGGNIEIKADKDFKVEAKTIEFKAAQEYKVDASQVKFNVKAKIEMMAMGMVDIKSSAIMTLKGAMINLNT